MRQGDAVDIDVATAEALEVFRRARTRRSVAQTMEASALYSVVATARDAGLSVRQIATLANVPPATIGRRIVKNAPDMPDQWFDEDEWVAAEDIVREHQPDAHYDRAPWKVIEAPDGSRTTKMIFSGVAVAAPVDGGPVEGADNDDLQDQDDIEPLRGITAKEYETLRANGLETDESRRIARRLARAVLRVLHPGVIRQGGVLNAAVAGVMRDIEGAMILADLASPTVPGSNPAWEQDLQTRRARGYYLAAPRDGQ